MTTTPMVFTDPDAIGLERTRYFPRQLVTPDDLTQDQRYFRDKLRRHNRLLHGWGIVCGVDVAPAGSPWQVRISPGYVLGPHGDEILVSDPFTYDLRNDQLDGADLCGGGELDPWCSDVRVTRQAGQVLYLAIRYDECVARPVRVAADACGCDQTACEYSRIRDSFVVKALTALPSSYPGRLPQPDDASLFACDRDPRAEARHPGRACAPCPPEPWVVLAAVTPGAEGRIDAAAIDGPSYRRYVVTFADYYISCAPRQQQAGGINEAVITAVATTLSPKGVELLETLGDDPSVLGSLPVTALKGVNASTAKRVEALGHRTVDDVSTLDRTEWVKSFTTGLTGDKARAAEKQADAIWESANRISRWTGSAPGR